MDQVELFLVFTRPLEQAGINYMVTGSVVSMLYGIPRFTHDVDLVLELPPHNIDGITKAFPLCDFYCPPPEVLQIESRRSRRGHFNIIHHKTGFKADMYIHRDDDLQAWGLARKKLMEISAASRMWTAPPEYVILRKLEYYREGLQEKHVHDIEGMLEVSGDSIDMDVVSDWADRLGIQDQLKRVLEKE
jgi:hypothetical protein